MSEQESSFLLILLYIVIWFILMATLDITARRKNRNNVLWDLAGVLFTPLVILPLLACPPHPDPSDRRQGLPPSKMATKVKVK